MQETLLNMINIKKSFLGIHALNGVDFELKKGEIHALIGENGAGKSTLVKIINGYEKPDSGEIFLKNERVKINNTADATKLGIQMIYQELSLIPNLDIATNIFLGKEPKKLIFLLNKKSVYQETNKLFQKLNISLNPYTIVSDLTIGQQQMVEIAKAFLTKLSILIMDEPTSALSGTEKTILFEDLNNYKKLGVSIIYITHKLDEVLTIADRITVLRDGNYKGTFINENINQEKLIELLMGKELEGIHYEKREIKKEKYFEVINLSSNSGISIHDINIQIHKKEIVGITGLVGAGKSEVARAIFGIDPKINGKIIMNNKEIFITSPYDAVNHGLALIPENRREEGLILNTSILKNITTVFLYKMAKLLFVDERLGLSETKKYLKKLNIKTPNPHFITGNLSGGNQQKVVIGKWLINDPTLLILDEPTRGIDVGAKAEILLLIREMADKSELGVLFISSEIEEVLNICDTIILMQNGRIVKVLPRNESTKESILYYATGGK